MIISSKSNGSAVEGKASETVTVGLDNPALMGFILRPMKGILPTLGWIAVGLALLLSFGLDFTNTAQGGAIDLRNRITGVRLLEHGIDAYRYKWHEGEPEEYGDLYNNPKLPVSQTTATPALLMLHLPLAVLPYRPAQLIWFAAQWALLLGTGWLWLRACREPWQRWAVLIFLAGFTYTTAWRLHAERGQAYVLLVFLLAWWITLTLEPKRGGGFFAGLLAGLLFALRPPFLLLAPFMVMHRRRQLIGAAVGLLLGIGLPLLMNHDAWSDYFSGMEQHSELYRNNINPLPGKRLFPGTMEGIPTDTLGNYVAIPYADFSAYALLKALGLEQSWLGDEAVPAWPAFLVLAMLFAFWFWWSRGLAAEAQLIGFVAWLFLADFFLPAFRDSYNDVLILNVVFLGLIATNEIPRAAWPCAVALPLGWAVYAFAPEQAWIIDVPTALLTVGVVMFLFLPIYEKASSPVRAT